MLEGCAEDFILPVGTLSEEGRSSVIWIGLVDFAAFHESVVEFCILAEIHHVQTGRLPRKSGHAVIGDLGIIFLTMLCSDEDYAVSSLCSVDRCR